MFNKQNASLLSRYWKLSLWFPSAGIGSRSFLALTISMYIVLFYKTGTICNLDHDGSWLLKTIKSC